MPSPVKITLSVIITLVLIAFTVYFMFPNVYAQTYDQDITKLLQVSGTTQTMEQAMNTMFSQMESIIPPNVSNKFKQKMKDSVGEMMTEFIPIYKKYFSQDEIKELIRFYESPIGRKMVANQPAMMEESMSIGNKYGETLMKEIMQEMGY